MSSSFNTSRRGAVALLLSASFAPGWPALAAVSSDFARFRALLDRSADDAARLDPIGTDRDPDDRSTQPFVDPLTDAFKARLRAAKARDLAQLKTVDRAALPAADRIAFDVFDYDTRQQLAFIDSGLFDVARRAPLDPSFGIHVELPDFIAGGGARFKTAADRERGLQRLDLFATYLGHMVERLREGLETGQVQSRVIVENMLKQLDAALALPVEDSPFMAAAKRMPADMGGRYRVATSARVYPALKALQTFLRTSYLPRATEAPGRWAMKDGDRLYAAELERHTTTTKSADELHQLGLSEVARIRAEMEKVRAEVGFAGTLAQFFDHVRTDPRFYFTEQSQLVARFAEIEARIWKGIPRLFAKWPKAPFEVRPLPVLGDQRGTGYYKAGNGDGKSPGILFVNMSMLPTRPIPTLETLTMHEGIPGHHFQINLAREDKSLPKLLRFGSSTAYQEGWGLYAESLGRELGMFTDPMQWFGHLDMEMLRAVRLVVDTGLHAKRWSRDKAIRFMLDNTSMAPRDVAVEIDRYLALPGQACAYKVGELKIRGLREKAERAMGGRFDVRAFHDVVLNTGALPLDVLERKVDGWIGATTA